MDQQLELKVLNRTQSYCSCYRGMVIGKLNEILSFGLLVLLTLLAAPTQAQRSQGPTADIPDSRTVKTQRKVEQLFERGEYDRAYFIYRNELVPVGDKYAQYMIGFMHLTGMGVGEDPVTASAWYRLAAERGTPQFIAVRDMLLEDLSAEERRQSDQMFLEIRRNYSDLIILFKSIKRNAREVRPTTGSRLRSGSNTMTVVETTSPNRPQSSVGYFDRIENELEGNLVMLAEIGGFTDLETDPSRVDIDEVERLVYERLESIPD
ncbi:MAG: hypothetical protein ACR2RD_18210 [Woeseiaceae bacterium]